MKKLVLGITGTVSFLAFVILAVVTGRLAREPVEQHMASRWSKEGGVAQVSCFFSAETNVTEDTLQEFEYNLQNYLQESSITVESENPGARLWVSAYSAEGKIRLATDYGNLEADALGVGGDFFLFHPQELLCGSYFSGNDVNQDYCVIDEDAAWQLFGSNDVAGMMVEIDGRPHIVTGVIRRQEGKLYEAAGLDATRVYVSLPTLHNYGTSHGISHYEVLMPNPVKNFAYNYVKEKLGSDERETQVLENTTRYHLLNRLKVIKAFGTRSMNGKSIIYPYWENVARGYEDIIALLTVVMFVCLAYPVVLATVCFVRWWKHKSWTFHDIWIKIIYEVERLRENRYNRKRQDEEELL